MSFADLKRNRDKMFQQLNDQIEKDKTGGRQKDERIWYPKVDQAGNGYAEIRFLPAPDGEACPYVKLFEHGFKGPGGWYIEKSLTTIGKQDFVAEENQRLWNVTDEVEKRANQALIRGDFKKKIPGRKRNLSYFANVYIINDPAEPENNGTVRLFRYGKQLHDRLMEFMQPDPNDPDARKVNPFDLFGPGKDPEKQPGGANFKLKIGKNSEGARSYVKSDFREVGPLFDDEDKMEEVWKKAYSLQEIIDPKNFKSYEELKERYLRVVGNAPRGGRNNAPEASEPEPTVDRLSNRRTAAEEPAPWDQDTGDNPPADATAGDDDEDLAYFRSIAE